jgi:outer membrane receptor for ferric coprogen and ferric-rhodotorulic acid
MPLHAQRPNGAALTPLAQAVRTVLASALLVSASTSARAQAAAPTGGETTLPSVTIKASSAANTVTEGSGAYTTGATSTATGLNLSLRDTPQAVSVITSERMKDQAMDTVEDALRNTTGISIKNTDRGRNDLTARGFRITNYQFDGVPMFTGNIGAETLSTEPFDRIEVVRGATGLLNGAGDPSAAVNLVRKHANSKTFTATVEAELGSWNHRAGTLDLTTPLNSDASVRARLVLHANEQDAFIDLENTKGSVFYGVVDADLTPDTRLSVGASQETRQRNGVYWGGLTYWYADGTRTDWDRSKTTATRWNQWDTEETSAFASLEHKLDNRWRLRADLSHRQQVEDSKLLWATGVPDRASGLGLSAYPYHYHAEPTQTHVGVSATGPLALWGREHELTVGVMRSQLKNGWDNRDAVGNVAEVGNFNQWDGSYPEPAMTAFYLANQGTTTQTGAYMASRLQITDALKFIVGGRVSSWKRDEEVGAWTPEAYTLRHSSVFTPYAGVVMDLSDNVSAYASYTTIFKPQTEKDRHGQYLDPLEGNSAEIGVKGEFFNGRLNASAAVFRVDQDNFATPDAGHFVPGTTTVASVAAQGVKSQGIELEVSGEVTPGWQLGAGWTQFSARDAQGVHVVAEHPRQQLKLFTKHSFGGALQGLSLGGGLVWESTPPITATNPVTGLDERVGQPAYTVVDVMAAYAFSAKTSVQLNIGNLLDKAYYSSSWSGYTYGEPRTFTVSLKHRF